MIGSSNADCYTGEMDRNTLIAQIDAADDKIAQRRSEMEALRSILFLREKDGHDTSVGRSELDRREEALALYIEHRWRLAAELKAT